MAKQESFGASNKTTPINNYFDAESRAYWNDTCLEVVKWGLDEVIEDAKKWMGDYGMPHPEDHSDSPHCLICRLQTIRRSADTGESKHLRRFQVQGEQEQPR